MRFEVRFRRWAFSVGNRRTWLWLYASLLPSCQGESWCKSFLSQKEVVQSLSRWQQAWSFQSFPIALSYQWREYEDNYLGIVFEAVLACYALQFEPSFACKCRKSLRWSCGSQASWQDMFCVACNCKYEIKTKADMEKIEKAFEHNNFQGGSFKCYCAIRNALRSDQKMFLVVLPRKFTIVHTITGQGHKIYLVFVSEIDRVAPTLAVSSFNPVFKKANFQSRVSVKLRTKTKWFDLPLPTLPIDYREIFERAFIDYFSQEEYERFRSELSSKSDSGAFESIAIHNYGHNDASSPSRQPSKVEALKASLESLQAGDAEVDDWEDIC